MSEVGPQDRPMCDWPEVQVLPGVVDCLQALRGRFTLCVATNASISGRAEILKALQRGGIAQGFDHVFCPMELGLRKNQPDFWAAVAATLGHPLDQVAMVGDSLEHDALAPRRFDVHAFWLNPGGLQPATAVGVPQVRRLDEFARLVCGVAGA